MTTSIRDALAGRYRIEREIGRGAMATVYLARDLQQGRQVAVKVLHQDHSTTNIAERFLREVCTAANLQHPNILPLYDSGEADGLLYYTMPYVEGESLADRLRTRGPLPVSQAIRIATEVADALAYAHQLGVIHRDIKPANVLLAGGDHACVADFGLVALAHAATNLRLTGVGVGVGSPHYMSPEQALGEGEPTGKADVYSLGCMLYETLTGRPPFDGNTAQAIGHQHLYVDPTPPSRLRGEVDPQLDRLVLTAMAKDPARRPNAEGVRAALERLGFELFPAHAPSRRGPGKINFSRLALPVPYRQRSGRPAQVRLGWIAVFAMLVIGVGIGLWWWTTGQIRSASASPIAVAVIPFTAASGEEAEAEALRVLFRDEIQVAAPIVTFDGSALLAQAELSGPNVILDLLERATRAGASYVVTANIVGRPRRITLSLYDLETGRRVFHQTGGSAAEPVEAAISRLAIEMLRVISEGGIPELEGLSNILNSTSSPTALNELLQARLLLWSGETDKAVAGFRRAIQADSNFAPGYFYLSLAEIWSPRWNYDAGLEVIETGLQRSSLMPARWTRLLEAQQRYILHDGNGAANGFSRLILEDRRFAEARFGLGDAYFHLWTRLGEGPAGSLSDFKALAATDSSFAPIYTYGHLVDAAILSGDTQTARTYLGRLSSEQLRSRSLALDLRYGTSEERRAALDALTDLDGASLTELVYFSATEAGMLDTISRAFLVPNRSPADRQLGARFQLAALGVRGRWDEAVTVWRSNVEESHFDPWIIHAYLAGQPVRSLAAPMFDWAQQLVEATESVDFRQEHEKGGDALRALVSRALLEGDSADADWLMNRVGAARASRTDPEPEALQRSLEARKALLAGDTTGAINHLEQALSRGPWAPDYYARPLGDGAVQRILLASIYDARGATDQARRLARTFESTLVVGDILYARRARAIPSQVRAGGNVPI